jgi:hypothetical protein
MRIARDGADYRLEINDVRTRIFRAIDSKWITLDGQDDDSVREKLNDYLTCEVRRFDYAMSVFFRFYR